MRLVLTKPLECDIISLSNRAALLLDIKAAGGAFVFLSDTLVDLSTLKLQGV